MICVKLELLRYSFLSFSEFSRIWWKILWTEKFSECFRIMEKSSPEKIIGNFVFIKEIKEVCKFHISIDRCGRWTCWHYRWVIFPFSTNKGSRKFITPKIFNSRMKKNVIPYHCILFIKFVPSLVRAPLTIGNFLSKLTKNYSQELVAKFK